MNAEMMNAELMERLDSLHAKLDRIDQRQRITEDVIRGMTPVATEAMANITAQLADWEARGWFDLVAEFSTLIERAADRYTPQDLRQLSNTLFDVIDTVQHASEAKPLGPLGLIGATREPDVKRGLAVGMQMLRHLGRVGAGEPTAPRAKRPALAPATPAAATASKAPSQPAPQPKATPESEVVVWEGQRFTQDGYLLDTEAWTPDLAQKMAGGLGLNLSDDHWTVLRWAREDYLAHSCSPNVRRIASGSGIGTKRMYELFPQTPGKSTAMIAGIPKPVGCV